MDACSWLVATTRLSTRTAAAVPWTLPPRKFSMQARRHFLLQPPHCSPPAAATKLFFFPITTVCCSMATARSNATGSVLKQDGVLLVAGGKDASGAALSSSELYGFATVKTDAADYPPGTTVNITGSGWQPGETVTLTLVESPLIDTHGPYPVVADSNGNISDSSFVTDAHDANVKFTLTAGGSVSQAQTTF